jgi:sugar phosphate isomerase/epimerase
MELELFKTLWGHEGSLTDAIQLCHQAGFVGIEAPAPLDPTERRAFFEALEAAELEWIAEISTCTPSGVFVPLPHRSVEDHLESLEDGIFRSMEGSPRFINTMAGYDAWSTADAVRFHEGVVRLQEMHEIIISVETHRGRSTYSPWLTREILRAVPELRITCDFSHWCVVSERLILDEEPEILALAAAHAHHIQPRVGYNQGPQVPDPRAPEHLANLAAHERWWTDIWNSMASRGFTQFTMTPEFGPDGYLQCAPFSQQPVADLWDVNRWIGHRQSERFQLQFNSAI